MIIWLLILILVSLNGGTRKCLVEPLGEFLRDAGKLLLWVIAIPIASIAAVFLVGGAKPHYHSKHFPHYLWADVGIGCAGLGIVVFSYLIFFARI